MLMEDLIPQNILRTLSYNIIILIFGLLGTGCTIPESGTTLHRLFPKDYVHPLTEINFEKVMNENRGLKILEENATTVNDCYRGGVQTKEEGERLLKDEKWEQARIHFEKSNKFLRIVLNYLPEDEAYRNFHGDEVTIFMPNLLMADNYLKLIKIYKEMKLDKEFSKAKQRAADYLYRSLKSVKTEWAYEIKKKLERENVSLQKSQDGLSECIPSQLSGGEQERVAIAWGGL